MSGSAVRLKHVADINRRSLSEDEPGDLEFRYIDISTVGRGCLVAEPVRMRFADAPSRARRVVRAGDTIVSTVRTYLRAVWPVTGSTDDVVVSTGFAVLSPRPELNSRYLAWWAQSDEFIEGIVARSVGVSYPAIRAEEIGDIAIVLPDADAQREIAEFLDGETARIDRLIERKSRMIDLLDERRRSLISDLVMGGVSAGFRDLPPGWEIRRLRHAVAATTVGVVVNPSSYFVDEGVPFLHGSDIRDGWIDTSALKYLSRESNDLLAKSKLRSGDVVVVRAGYPGRAAVIPPELDGCNCASILILRRGSLLEPDFLCAFMNSSAAREQVAAAQYGAAQEQINVSDVVDFRIVVPPFETQRAIIGEINLRCESIDRLRAMTVRHIDLLRERRQALVNLAVMGELGVAEAIAS